MLVKAGTNEYPIDGATVGNGLENCARATTPRTMRRSMRRYFIAVRTVGQESLTSRSLFAMAAKVKGHQALLLARRPSPIHHPTCDRTVGRKSYHVNRIIRGMLRASGGPP